jgi:(1->4)-alpha-D-glucan 1-alpha-D-glucosylmutase
MTRVGTAVDPSKLPVASPATLPRATVRLQLNHTFGFDDALACLPYFEQLGISHVFASPILTARAGSMHGYDVVDHTTVNPELGGEEGLRRLVDGLRARGMGLIVDVVPNHMAVGGSDNPRWLDVLEWGRDSRNAEFFDIDWDVPDPAINGRVLVPLLGAPFGEVLAAGELQLKFERGRFHFSYFEHRFPVAPKLYAALLDRAVPPALSARFVEALKRRGLDARRMAFEAGVEALDAAVTGDPALAQALDQVLALHDARDPEGRQRLQRLLDRQNYRLAWWRSAADEINWRRFFDINELAALRMQDRAVFEAVHAATFRLYAAGLIDGLRIDHVDGLADPRTYCRQLRSRLARLEARRPPEAPQGPAYIVVEKILAPGEKLAQDWQVDGTSGYSFMNDVSALLHDARGEPTLTRMWALCRGAEFADEERRARRRIPQELFSADFAACAHALHQVARSDPETRDWSLAAVRRVLLELLVHFPVYRTYADARGRSAADAAIMQRVVEAAEQSCRPSERRLLHLIDRWLGGEPARKVKGSYARRARLRALARFQQLTSPVAAKSVEDTAFYRHGRLLSRNEVGADPGQFTITADLFHRICADRQRRYPGALLATATHDHKRGEDVRMRLAVLSESPEDWVRVVTEWTTMNVPLRHAGGQDAPDETDEYIFYQMLVGTWPPQLRPDAAEGLAAFCARLVAWQQKAVREAKRHSGWVEPNLDYEQACQHFVEHLLDPQRSPAFLRSVHDFVQSIAAAGAIKGLSQTLLRITSPGVPDLYQGTEFWDFSMVDPDNRQPVDFDARRRAIADTSPSATLLREWTDGAVKQRLILRSLELRRQMPLVFSHGTYRSLRLRGQHADRIVAYARTLGRVSVVVIAPRYPQALLAGGDAGLRIPAERWADTCVELPRSLAGRPWTDALEQREIGVFEDGCVVLSRLLDPWPLGLLFAREAGTADR